MAESTPSELPAATGRIASPAPGFSRRAALLWLLLFAVLVGLRSPILLLEPRFAAEEATVHFAYARHHGMLHSLLLVPTTFGPAGYLNLIPNLAATLSTRLVPVEQAPVVSTLMAWWVQMLPFLVVLFGHSYLWRQPRQRLEVCALLLLSPALVPEVWLNTINSQVFFGLTTLVLLLEDLRGVSRRRARLYRGLLLLGGLTGPYTAFLAPCFLIKHLWEKSRETRRQAWIVGGTAALQAAVFLWTYLEYSPRRERFAATDWGQRAAVVLDHHVLRPVFGGRLCDRLADTLGLPQISGSPEMTTAAAQVAGLGGLVVVGLFVAWMARSPRCRMALLLPASFVVSVLCIASSTAPTPPWGRYAVLPGMMTLLMLWNAAASPETPARRRICRALLLVAVLAGIDTYSRDVLDGSVAVGPNRPRWASEVAVWRQDPTYLPRISPRRSDLLGRTIIPRHDASEAAPVVRDVPLQLIATGRTTRRTFAVDGLPSDFKIVVDLRASHGFEEAQLRLVLRQADGAIVFSLPIRELVPGLSHRTVIHRLELRPRPRTHHEDVAYITFVLRPQITAPVRVTVGRLRVAPRVESSLEPILASVALPSRLYAETDRPLAEEAGPVLAAESLARDGDLRFDSRDLARADARWPGAAGALRLRGSPEGGLSYGGSPAYSLLSWPFFLALGPAGQVLLNGALFLILLAAARRACAAPGEGAAVVAFFGASAVVGYVFLPQGDLLRMVCLFVPLAGWMRPPPDSPAGPPSRRWCALSGALLGVAALEGVLPAAVAAGAVIGLALTLPRQRSGILLAGALTAMLAIGLCAGALGSGGSTAPAEVRTISEPPAADEATTLVDRLPSATADDERSPRTWLHESWLFLLGRDRGVLPFYPFALLALLLFARGEADRPRVALFAILTGVCLVLWLGAAADPPSLLGSRGFAALYPLFLLLPTGWAVDRRLLLAACLVAFVFTLPMIDRVWNPRATAHRPPPKTFELLPAGDQPVAGEDPRLRSLPEEWRLVDELRSEEPEKP